jgi:hypothetical protein
MICHCILSLQTQCKRFNQDCSEVCSSLQPQQASSTASSASAMVAASAAAAACGAADSLSSSDVFRAMKFWSISKPLAHANETTKSQQAIHIHYECIYL